MMSFLDNELFTVEQRLEAAKMMIAIQDESIIALEKLLEYERSTKAWAVDQEGIQRMGL